jgi:nucleotide-binding universal stress UspA family protein
MEDIMKFKTIIAAINMDDDLAPGVLKTAIMLAKRDQAKLWVVDVWPDLNYTMATGIADPLGATAMLPSEANLEADRKARNEREKELKAQVSKELPGSEASILVGEPAKQITDYAREKDAELIVVGTHQKGAWKALFDGAPSRDIVRESPCAVFLVPKPFAEKIIDAD